MKKRIFLLITLFLFSSDVFATSPCAPAKFLLSLGLNIDSREDLMPLLIAKKQEVVKVYSFINPVTNIKVFKDKVLFKNALTEDIEFLFGQMSVEFIKPSKVCFPFKDKVFRVLVPVVLKGNEYSIERSRTIIGKISNQKEFSRIVDRQGDLIKEKRVVEQVPVEANKVILYVAKDGNVFCQDPTGSRVRISNAKEAIELIKVKDIFRTNNWWKYVAVKKDNAWIVRLEFTGPSSVSIMKPPVWKIIVDKKGLVKDFKEIFLGRCDVNGDGDCDFLDVKRLQTLVGECLPESRRFNVIADQDHDDCITEKDRQILIGEIE